MLTYIGLLVALVTLLSAVDILSNLRSANLVVK